MATELVKEYVAMNRANLWSIACVLACVALAVSPTSTNGQGTERTGAQAVVLLVRHAEKATEPADNPALTDAGVARAQALADALRDAGVTTIITTQLRRTRDTAQPLATSRRITPEVVPIARGEMDAHVGAVVAAVRRQTGGVVLIVGHSNSIPAIIAALGGPRLPDICESQHAELFVLYPGGGETRLVRSHYGAPDPEPGPECK